jgi:tRNA U34 5-methylaminomethyl-2-thiouridine-forming methyltransferase MnmC
MKTFTRQIRTTADGSKTIYIPELDENYHSTHGAIQEALHVFIQHGFHFIQKRSEVKILEIGFGTGLNALLTILASEKYACAVDYVGIEAFPVESELLNEMDYPLQLNSKVAETYFSDIHSCRYGERTQLSPNFNLTKIEQELAFFSPAKEEFDLIYFDAFGPRAQSDMWSQDHFRKLHLSLTQNGVLVTYCAKGQVKRDLKAVGFEIEALPGPPGKREMTRARKVLNLEIRS